MGAKKRNYHSRSQTPGMVSRVIQVTLKGVRLKAFVEEVIRDEQPEATTARDLINEAIAARLDKRNGKTKYPFFDNGK